MRHACCNPAHLEDVTQRENHAYSLYAWGSQMAAKTHCPQGHEYSVDNTIVKVQSKTGGPNRVCRTCKADLQRKRRAKR